MRPRILKLIVVVTMLALSTVAYGWIWVDIGVQHSHPFG